MSSVRNSLHRRTHKERSQPKHRQKLGILEKHKDYVLRAQDFHSKQDRIRRLKQKVSDRNKDEFYFGMVNHKTNAGIHVQDRGNAAMPLDMVKVLKTQDENYIRTMRMRGLKKIDKLTAKLSALADLAVLPGDDEMEETLDENESAILRKVGILKVTQPASKGWRNHIIFVENEEQVNKYIGSSSASIFHDDDLSGVEEDEEEVDLGWKAGPAPKFSLCRTEEEKQLESERMKELREEGKKHKTRLLKELAARLFRDIQLGYARHELEMQRQLMGKGGRRKIRGVEKVEGDDNEDENEDADTQDTTNDAAEKVYKPRVYKWRAERKR